MKQAEINAVLQYALDLGAEFAELFLEDRDECNISYKNSSVGNIAQARRKGAGLYLISGTECAYVYTNSLSCDEMMKLARVGAAMLKEKKQGRFTEPKTMSTGLFNPCEAKILPAEIAHTKKIKILENADQAMRGSCKYLRSLELTYFDVDQRVRIANTEGVLAEDRRVVSRIRQMPKLEDGDKSAGHFTDFTRPMGFEAFSDEGYINCLTADLKSMEEIMFAEPAPVGRMPVIFAAGGSSGTFFHEACGHGLEVTNLQLDPTYAGKMGLQIASDKVTIIDDGTLPQMYGSSIYDDEGMPRQKNVLIENGILKSYLVDRIGSIRTGFARTGSGRRQDYTYAPAARMSNTYLACGKDDEEEMIRSVPYGLFVEELGGGTAGEEFSLGAQRAYLIKNGKLDRLVKGAILTGRAKDAMMNIDRVGKKMVYEDGGAFCGADSGLVNTTTSGAQMRIKEMMVGGEK